jgi:hypothetical protein
MRKILAGLAILAALAGFTHSFAQVPPPVPALPDAERRTSVVLSASTGPIPVGFAIYGDGTDYANWLEVFCNNVRMAPISAWTLTSPSGPLTNLSRPITDGQVTFVSPQTCTVQIVGARRPRRTSQFAENRGVAARDLNQVLTDIIAQNREQWDQLNDFTGRTLSGLPGETLKTLPPASQRALQVLGFDATGLIPTMYSAAGGGGSGSLSVGGTPISGGTNGRPLFDNAGVLGEFTTAQFTAYCNVFTTGTLGCVPASPGGTVNFLRADGTWSTPVGSGGITIGSTSITGGTTTRVLFDNAGIVSEYTNAQLTALCQTFTSVLSGCVPVSGGGTANFLRADGTFAPPPGGGITIGSTTIAGGTTTRVLFDNAGVVSEYTNAQLTALCNVFTVSLNGCVPFPTTATGKVLSDNGTWVVLSGGGSVTSVTANNGLTASPNPIVGTGTIGLATLTANQVLGNFTSGTTFPIGVNVPSCSGNNNAILYLSNTGFTCATTIAYLNVVDQNLTGGANVTVPAAVAGNQTIDCGKSPLQTILNTGAFNLTAPLLDGSCIVEVVNGNGAGAVTLLQFGTATPQGAVFSSAVTKTSAVTVTSAAPGIVSWTAHAFTAATKVYFTAAVMPTGLVSGTIYYVCAGSTLLTNSFAVATNRTNALAGTCITTSSTGTTVVGNQPSVFDLSIAEINGTAVGSWTQVQ